MIPGILIGLGAGLTVYKIKTNYNNTSNDKL